MVYVPAGRCANGSAHATAQALRGFGSMPSPLPWHPSSLHPGRTRRPAPSWDALVPRCGLQAPQLLFQLLAPLLRIEQRLNRGLCRAQRVPHLPSAKPRQRWVEAPQRLSQLLAFPAEETPIALTPAGCRHELHPARHAPQRPRKPSEPPPRPSRPCAAQEPSNRL